MEVKNAFSPGGPAYVSPPEGATDVRSVSPNPPEPGRNLLNPHLPGTRAFTERVNAWEPPNPLTTKPSGNYMYDVGAAAPIAVEQAFSKIAAKALPAKAIETKLLQMGASKAELEARGVLGYLEAQGTRPVHPLEVMKHLDDTPYRLNEIVNKSEKQITKGYYISYADGTTIGSPFKSVDEARDAIRTTFTDNPDKFQIIKRDIEVNPNPTKFVQWQTPGGTNYREILLQAPTQKPTPTTNRTRLRSIYGDEINNTTDEQLLTTFKEADKSDFISGHWNEPNIVAHMRVNDRTLPSGEKALHVEEWQSDWANALRQEKGYSPPSGNHAPPHPIVKNWQDLMARRTLKEAVDGGYDRLTWTTGAQQADRYDLSKHFDALHYRKLKDGTFGVVGTTVDGGTMNIADRATAEELPGIIGKDVARRIVAGEGKESAATAGKMRLDGLNLKVGGEWATKLYDESMVNRFNKIGKRYGVKVEDITVPSAPVVPKTHREFGYEDRLPKVPTQFHSLKITPEMRQSIGATKFHPFADLPGPK